MNRTGEEPLTYDQLKERVLHELRTGKHELTHKSQIGMIIWPKNTMVAQGLAGAASRIVKRMERDKLVYWHFDCTRRSSRWVLRIARPGS